MSQDNKINLSISSLEKENEKVIVMAINQLKKSNLISSVYSEVTSSPFKASE